MKWRFLVLVPYILAQASRTVLAQGVTGEPDTTTYSPADLDPGWSLPEAHVNRAEMKEIAHRLYPSDLQTAGIGGTISIEFVIQPDGRVDSTSVWMVRSHLTPLFSAAIEEDLAAASVELAKRFRFEPPRAEGRPVRLRLRLPIVWEPDV